MVRSPPSQLWYSSYWGAILKEFLWRLHWAWRESGKPPLQATSWWRSEADNAAAGGRPYSQHLVGTALDLVGEQLGLTAFAQAAESNNLTVVRYKTHIHVQLMPAGILERIITG